jgi:hypothetical protein
LITREAESPLFLKKWLKSEKKCSVLEREWGGGNAKTGQKGLSVHALQLSEWEEEEKCVEDGSVEVHLRLFVYVVVIYIYIYI